MQGSVLMKIKTSVCPSLVQAQNKSVSVNMSLAFLSPLRRQPVVSQGRRWVAGGNDPFVSAGRRCVRASQMATAHMYSSFRSSELNVPFNKDETLTYICISVSLNGTLKWIKQHRDHSCTIAEAGKMA